MSRRTVDQSVVDQVYQAMAGFSNEDVQDIFLCIQERRGSVQTAVTYVREMSPEVVEEALAIVRREREEAAFQPENPDADSSVDDLSKTGSSPGTPSLTAGSVDISEHGQLDPPSGLDLAPRHGLPLGVPLPFPAESKPPEPKPPRRDFTCEHRFGQPA